MNTALSSSNNTSSQDSSKLMLRMRPDEPVATSDGFSSTVAMVQIDGSMEADHLRKQPVIHYPESLQLGKRKFHHFDESASLPSYLDTGGMRTTTDDEAGLSLLFAASLLQQGGHLTSTSVDSTATIVPSVVDAATTMKSYGAGLEHSQPVSGFMSVQGANGGPRNEFTVIAASFKMSDGIEPTVNDVLCGRGGGINKHYGNIVYRRVVEYNKKVYKQVPKRHRMLVSRSIVQAILNAGGRFLQEQSSHGTTVWTEIPIRRAVQKTSQALRERSDDSNADAEEGDDTKESKQLLSSTNPPFSRSVEVNSQPASVEKRLLEEVV